MTCRVSEHLYHECPGGQPVCLGCGGHTSFVAVLALHFGVIVGCGVYRYHERSTS